MIFCYMRKNSILTILIYYYLLPQFIIVTLNFPYHQFIDYTFSSFRWFQATVSVEILSQAEIKQLQVVVELMES